MPAGSSRKAWGERKGGGKEREGGREYRRERDRVCVCWRGGGGGQREKRVCERDREGEREAGLKVECTKK